jgi:hypothetical protein
LPNPGSRPTERRDWSDDDLKNQSIGTIEASELILSSMNRITDAGLVHLSSFAGLRKLWLDDMGVNELKQANVSDAGLVHVGKLTSLTSLSVCTNAITDQGLARLHSLKNLKILYHDGLSSPGITADGLDRLKAAVPTLKAYDRAARRIRTQ